MNKKFRMGIIGCGGISRWHIKGVMDSPDLTVGALCDILPDRLDEKMKLCGVIPDSCYANHIEMMESGKVDAVSICTPNNIHYRIAMDAILHNLPYALEKPVCNSEADAAKLEEATEKAKLPHMVCFSYRFVAAARYARELIRKGALGNLYHINGDYLQSFGLPNANNGKPMGMVWRYNREVAGSGALGDLGCHLMDLFRFMTGREFTRLTADSGTFVAKRLAEDGSERLVDVDDYINIIGQMDGALAANLSITRFAYGRGNHQRVEVYGDTGAIRYTLEGKDEFEINMGNEPMRQNHVWCAVPVPTQYAANQMQCFADILNGCGDGLPATIKDGRINQRIVDSLIVSAETGKRVDL